MIAFQGTLSKVFLFFYFYSFVVKRSDQDQRKPQRCSLKFCHTFFYTFFSFSLFEVQNFLIRLKDSLRLSASKPLWTRITVRVTETLHTPPSQKFENMSSKLWGGSTWLGFNIRVWKGQHKYTNCLNSIIPIIIYHNKSYVFEY